ncbi:helix-hairpin-helix domain-containing protein [candidate division WOR-3 bacterium]|nr:helix-hairpin-helix domain-containing protein [candidate division WOR-3 bacterium]
MGSLSKDELILVVTILLIFFAGTIGLVLREKKGIRFSSYGEKEMSTIEVLSNRAYVKRFFDTRDSSLNDSVEAVENPLRSDSVLCQIPITLLVNINTAQAHEFEKLPGIGPVIAQRIVEYRNEHGNFQHASDLQKVRGIGPVKFSKIENLITL